MLLVSLNAKFVHSTLALHSIKRYNQEYSNIKIKEYTINNNLDFILDDIYKENEDVVCFSCYIWNINETIEICKNLRKISKCEILLGGPEVSFDPEEYMNYVDYVIRGEGELAFKDFIQYKLGLKKIEDVSSLTYNKGGIVSNRQSLPINLNDLPFVYNDLKKFENRILYYETTRGCPFNCQYCLSSTFNGVRFLNIKRVYEELSFFLDNKVKQVKFIDRTFNASSEHRYKIWEFIIKSDNDITNFHFEIAADLFEQRDFDLLKTARKGLIQFEIGIQTTNGKTLELVARKTNLKKVFENINKIFKMGNIHLHLDLIAGLPSENYESFKNSFNDVYKMQCEQLQLGFLKVLKGSGMRKNANALGLMYREKAPYEVLRTKEISFKELSILKGIEELVDIYYNSNRFHTSIMYLGGLFKEYFDFYLALHEFFISMDYHKVSHKKQTYYTILQEFYSTYFEKDDNILIELLLFDLYSNENIKSVPDILNIHEKLLFDEKDFTYITKYTRSQIIKNTHSEKFNIDIIHFSKNNEIIHGEFIYIFDYTKTRENNYDNAYIWRKYE
ncbi:MAG: B12-binding domain-containing radical SAM protein [Lachnospirales bacterium]